MKYIYDPKNNIELTTDHLLNFGFIQGDNIICNPNYYYLKFMSRILLVNLNVNMIILCDNYSDEYPKYSKKDIQIPINLKTIYQLEALYYGLTNENLQTIRDFNFKELLDVTRV